MTSKPTWSNAPWRSSTSAFFGDSPAKWFGAEQLDYWDRNAPLPEILSEICRAFESHTKERRCGVALRGGSPEWYVALVAYRPGEATRASGYGAPGTTAKLGS